MDLDKIKEDFLKQKTELKRIEDKINMRHRQIHRLENKKSKVQEKSWWGDLLIRPIMELVKQEFPQITWDIERLVPMGMCCRVSVFGSIDDKTVSMIGFTPRDTDNGVVHYDTTQREGDYMGDPNGFSIKSKPLTDLKEFFAYIQKQLDEKDPL